MSPLSREDIYFCPVKTFIFVYVIILNPILIAESHSIVIPPTSVNWDTVIKPNRTSKDKLAVTTFKPKTFRKS